MPLPLIHIQLPVNVDKNVNTREFLVRQNIKNRGFYDKRTHISCIFVTLISNLLRFMKQFTRNVSSFISIGLIRSKK